MTTIFRDSSYDGHVSRETLDLDSNSNSRLSMSVLPGYTDFNISHHNHKTINADHNFENYLLAHSSTHDYKSSRMPPAAKKVKANKVVKTSKSAVPSHLVSTPSAKNRTKTLNQDTSFQHHNNTNQNINSSSSSSNHVTVNRSTAAHTHSSHTDSRSANAQRTKISNGTNTYEKNTHAHTLKDKDKDRERDTHANTQTQTYLPPHSSPPTYTRYTLRSTPAPSSLRY